MCGRFTLTVDASELQEQFPWINIPEGKLQPRYNVAPTQPVAVVPNDGKNRLDYFIWGLIPSWSKDPKIGSRLINARAETLAEKPSFRSAFRYRRCLVLADGFYEWKKAPGGAQKTPYFIHLVGKKPFAFAGLWERWFSPDGSEVLSCTILTTEPNTLVSNIHNRMPVILDGEDALRTWLTPGEVPANYLTPLLKPYPAEKMLAYPVSTAVNSPVIDQASLIQPA
jgi:putative SOS response-associated peptidase YedK